MSFVLTVQASGPTRMPPVPGNQMGIRTLGVQWGADNKTPSLLHLGAVCICIPSVCREPPRCPGRQEADWGHLFRGAPPPFDGQGIWRWKNPCFGCIPPKKNRREPWDYDRELYKRRNEVERYFLRLKRFRKVFTRYDKRSSIFLSVVMLVMIFDAVFMWTGSSF